MIFFGAIRLIAGSFAVRLMSAFQIKPYSTWGLLDQQLVPYKNQLNGAGYYQSLIDGILDLFREGEYE